MSIKKQLCSWVLAASALIFLASSFPSSANFSLSSSLQIYEGDENPFKGLRVPSKQALLDASPFYRSRVGRRSCLDDLADLSRGYEATYPKLDWERFSLLWRWRIAMVHFPDVVVCALKVELADNLDEMERLGLSFESVPQNIIWDIAKFDLPPFVISKIRNNISDFVWMATQGYVPAMVELVKLSSRDDLIRLTPRYNYYLLSVIKDAGQLDDTCARLLRHAEQLLPPDDRAEIDTRVDTRSWPDDERMVID